MKNIIMCLLLLLSIGLKAQILEDYFKIASENNPGLQAKFTDFKAAIQRVYQVNSLPDPTLSFGFFISPVETRVGPQQARFSLTQMFPWFGTLKAQGNAATLLSEAKYQAFLDARNQLYYQIAAAYYPLYELNEWKIMEEENISLLESYKNIALKKFEFGQSSMVDVLRVDILLKDATTNLKILNAKEKPLHTSFNKLLNRNESEPVNIAVSISFNSLENNFRKDSLLANNPVLTEFDLKIKAGEASERAAEKQGLPKLGVGLDYIIIGERTDMDFTDNGKDALMPMVTISIPVFRGKYKAAKKEMQLMQESYSLQKNDYANSLTAGYEMAWFELEQQQELISLYESQIEETNQALNLLMIAYGNSGKQFEEVLRMQQQLLKYKKMKATSIAQYQIALGKINYLTAKSY